MPLTPSSSNPIRTAFLYVMSVLCGGLTLLFVGQTAWMLYDILTNPKWAGGRRARWQVAWTTPALTTAFACVCLVVTLVLWKMADDEREQR